MPGKEQSRVLLITVSSGSGSGTVTNTWDIAKWVRIIPPSESATYDVTFKDADGDIIAARTSQLGTLSEMLEISLGILRTVLISSSSEDGSFKAKFDLHA